MDISVVGFGVMREYLPDPSGNRVTVRLPEDGTVQTLLRVLGVPETLLHMCLVDGERAGLDERLREGSEVTLMPPFSGGDDS